jgi:FKBP-type peptidyl-prolyl cis-trans isomerase (trigger factor)
MEARLKDDLARLGQSIETYLTQTKKTVEQIRTDWQGAADKRVKVRLILAEIARKENIQPEQDALEREVKHAKEHYPQADANLLRANVLQAMRNEGVLKLLENQ